MQCEPWVFLCPFSFDMDPILHTTGTSCSGRSKDEVHCVAPGTWVQVFPASACNLLVRGIVSGYADSLRFRGCAGSHDPQRSGSAGVCFRRFCFCGIALSTFCICSLFVEAVAAGSDCHSKGFWLWILCLRCLPCLWIGRLVSSAFLSFFGCVPYAGVAHLLAAPSSGERQTFGKGVRSVPWSRGSRQCAELLAGITVFGQAYGILEKGTGRCSCWI